MRKVVFSRVIGFCFARLYCWTGLELLLRSSGLELLLGILEMKTTYNSALA